MGRLAQALPARVLKGKFQIQASMALERRDRLDTAEQARFRYLADSIRDDSPNRLSKPERRELKQLWRKLDVRALRAERGASRRAGAHDGRRPHPRLDGSAERYLTGSPSPVGSR